MAFTWTYSMALDGNVIQKGVQEIRNNADWLKDNLVCQAHNTADNVTHDLSVNPADRATHCPSHNSSENVTHNIGYDGTVLSKNNNTAKSSEDLVADATHRAWDCPVDNNPHCTSDYNPYCGTDKHPNYIGDNGLYYSGDDGTKYTKAT